MARRVFTQTIYFGKLNKKGIWNLTSKLWHSWQWNLKDPNQSFVQIHLNHPKVTCTLLQLVMHPCDCYIWWFQVTCYICGRDFGSRSIGIHLPSCTKKWEQVKISWVSQNIAPLLSWSLGMLVHLTWSGSGAREASQEGAETFAHCSGWLWQGADETLILKVIFIKLMIIT